MIRYDAILRVQNGSEKIFGKLFFKQIFSLGGNYIESQYKIYNALKIFTLEQTKLQVLICCFS